MTKRDRSTTDERFRIRPGAPKARSPRFITRVLSEMSRAGGGDAVTPSRRPGVRLGRGHVAARFAGGSMQRDGRRVAIKGRIVKLKTASPESTTKHLRYIERDGVARDGGASKAYGPASDAADVAAFEQRGRGDRHQFRFILAPEDADQLEDLHGYTRALMTRMEADLGTKLDWVAVDHWDTDNAHTHLVLRGKDEIGHNLVIAGDYMSHGMRQRARELATQWLGPRTELEIRQSLSREVEQDRFTTLDRALQRQAQAGMIRFDRTAGDAHEGITPTLLLGRLQRLKAMGLAREASPGSWVLRPDMESVLRTQRERADIVRTMQRAMSGSRREFLLFNPAAEHACVVGRIASKGLADELNDRGYLVVDGIDGRAHYVPLGGQADLEQFPIGGIIQAHGARDRVADKTIAGLTRDGVYRTRDHLAMLGSGPGPHDRDPAEAVAAHVRRLEALRRAGQVERVAEGVWRIPPDLVQRGRKYDARELGDTAIELQSQLPIERQTRVIGATWLDRQLIAGRATAAQCGFGAEVRAALNERADFLVEQGYAQRRAGRLLLMRDLLATLREREIESAARSIAAETGSRFRQTVDGQRVKGVYRRSVMLASGRFALLDDGMGFSLVPWKPVIEQRLGHSISAIIRGGSVSWELGRGRALGIG